MKFKGIEPTQLLCFHLTPEVDSIFGIELVNINKQYGLIWIRAQDIIQLEVSTKNSNITVKAWAETTDENIQTIAIQADKIWLLHPNTTALIPLFYPELSGTELMSLRLPEESSLKSPEQKRILESLLIVWADDGISNIPDYLTDEELSKMPPLLVGAINTLKTSQESLEALLEEMAKAEGLNPEDY